MCFSTIFKMFSSHCDLQSFIPCVLPDLNDFHVLFFESFSRLSIVTLIIASLSPTMTTGIVRQQCEMNELKSWLGINSSAQYSRSPVLFSTTQVNFWDMRQIVRSGEAVRKCPDDATPFVSPRAGRKLGAASTPSSCRRINENRNSKANKVMLNNISSSPTYKSLYTYDGSDISPMTELF